MLADTIAIYARNDLINSFMFNDNQKKYNPKTATGSVGSLIGNINMDELIYALRAKLQRGAILRDNDDNVFAPHEIATHAAIITAEKQLGFPLCPLLKRIYTEVANGGFGPGSGIVGVGNGYTDDWGHNLEDLYEYFSTGNRNRYDASWGWPRGLLPFCHWGYATYSCVDCNQPGYPVVIIDPDYREENDDMEEMLIDHKDSIIDWFHDWLTGKDLWADAFNH